MTFESLDFYRGMATKYPTDRPFIREPRMDRRPRDSSATFHEVVDQWFFNRFGVRYRSQGVFLTARRLSAGGYAGSPAHVMRIIPITEYKYCWSPRVSDLLFKAKELANADAQAVQTFLDSAEYQEAGLEGAHTTGHEVMLYCSRYVAIPVGLLPGDASTPVASSGIVLPYSM